MCMLVMCKPSNTNFECVTDKGQTFYANVYVSDNRLMLRESVPGTKQKILCPVITMAFYSL